MVKITLFIDSRGQVVRTTTEPWSEDDDHAVQQRPSVPSPPQLVLNEEQKRFFTKAKAKGAHPVWSKLE